MANGIRKPILHTFATGETSITFETPQKRPRMLVVCMGRRSAPKSARLKDRDYDVTAYIFLILSLTCTPKSVMGRRRFARCSVDIVGEECEVYWSAKSGRWSVGRGEVKTLVVVSSVTWSVQW